MLLQKIETDMETLFICLSIALFFIYSYICTQKFKYIDSQSKLNVHVMEHVEIQEMKWDILGKNDIS